uniref:CCT domain-containing protein n=1 Tax=Triticum urartu TaxID=4572 RepID=A0A8R7TZ79_TRIUA
MSSSPSSSCGDLYDFSSSACTVRRVFSTGDLQGMNGSSPVPSGDGCGQDAGGGPFSQKVGRYSAEERKERVQRYRLKRHQRNFTKKITVRTIPISIRLCKCTPSLATNVLPSLALVPAVRVQEVAGRQPAEGEGPVREERRGGDGDRRPGGVRQQLRLLRLQRSQQPEHGEQPL